MKFNNNSVLANFIWRLFEKIGAQIVTFAVMVLLYRILDPSECGIVALIAVFTNILTVFVDCGLSSALIQKKEADDVDFSTVFWGQIFICFLIYSILFISAPFFSVFFNLDLTRMIRILGLTVLVAGVKNIQIAYVSRNMLFKKFFFSTIGGTVVAAICSICLALSGGGAWSLIVFFLVNNAVDTIILWIVVGWKPILVFSLDRLKNMLSYSWKLFASAVIDTCFENIRTLVIGKVYTSSDLAYYDQANRWPYAIVCNVNSSIDSVLFPSMSKRQDSKELVKNLTKRAIKTSTYVMTPLLVGLAVCGEPFFMLLLSDKWMPMIPYLIVFCIGYIFYPIHTANLNAIKSVGRSDYFLYMEIIKKVIAVVLLVISIPKGPMAICLTTLVSCILCQLINSWPNKTLIDYGYIEQIKDISPNLFLSILMGICIYWIKYLPIATILVVVFQVTLGIAVYLIGSILTKNESYFYIINVLKNFSVGD